MLWQGAVSGRRWLAPARPATGAGGGDRHRLPAPGECAHDGARCGLHVVEYTRASVGFDLLQQAAAWCYSYMLPSGSVRATCEAPRVAGVSRRLTGADPSRTGNTTKYPRRRIGMRHDGPNGWCHHPRRLSRGGAQRGVREARISLISALQGARPALGLDHRTQVIVQTPDGRGRPAATPRSL